MGASKVLVTVVEVDKEDAAAGGAGVVVAALARFLRLSSESFSRSALGRQVPLTDGMSVEDVFWWTAGIISMADLFLEMVVIALVESGGASRSVGVLIEVVDASCNVVLIDRGASLLTVFFST